MLTLHKLRLFVVVVERGSFNRAAEQLLTAQSAVSQNIASLESALGVTLFTRGPGGAVPTPAGQALYTYAQQILALVDEAERAVLQAADLPARQMSIAATPGISVYLLPMWMRTFQEAHPAIVVSLVTALTVDVVRETLGGRYDLGFLEGELDELESPSLGVIRLRDLDYGVVTRDPTLPDAVTLADLASRPFLDRQPSSRTRRWLDRLLEARGIALRRATELDSPGAVKYALLNGTGAAVLPRYAVDREVERGELRFLTVTDADLRRPLLMVYDGRRTLTPIMRAFMRGVGAG